MDLINGLPIESFSHLELRKEMYYRKNIVKTNNKDEIPQFVIDEIHLIYSELKRRDSSVGFRSTPGGSYNPKKNKHSKNIIPMIIGIIAFVCIGMFYSWGISSLIFVQLWMNNIIMNEKK